MAKYTMELRNVLAHGYKLFDFPYDFYDESKRAEFEEHFIKHFYFREIGCENVERFLWYLEDKFNTVFPYYNKLFETSTLEYSILDNYKLQDSYKITRDNTGKSAGFSSSVGKLTDSQTSETTSEGESAGTSKTTGTGSGTDTDTTTRTGSHTETTTNDLENTTIADSDTIVKDTTAKTADNEQVTTGTVDDAVQQRFLDTPQGAIAWNDIDGYATNLQQKETETETETTVTDTVDESTTTNRTDSNSTETTETRTGTVKVEGSENQTDTVNRTTSRTSEDNTTSSATDSNTTTATAQGEQKSTQDNNTRTESVSTQIETYEQLRVGNIGVDTDADMIQKHIKLQQILRNIEKMFFDECEDLFMLIY